MIIFDLSGKHMKSKMWLQICETFYFIFAWHCGLAGPGQKMKMMS